MKRHKVTFEESAMRHCSLRLTNCGGPTSHGLDGYACEDCLAYIASRFADVQSLSELPCGYCAMIPTFVGVRGSPICEACTQKGLMAARHYYTLHGGDAEGHST